MCAAGAKGKTFNQMRHVLHLPSTAAEMDLGFKTLFHQLMPKEEDQVVLDLAQGLWMQTGAKFLPLYQSRVVNDYMGTLRQANFKEEPTRASEEINQWVKEETRGKIINLFKPNQITPQTRLVVVSAIYLKAPFLHPFESTHTRDSTFTVNENRTVKIPLMYQKNYFPYYEGKYYSVIEIPYQPDEREVVLWVILPHSLEEEEYLFTDWGLSAMESVKKGLKPAYIELHLPRFQIRTDLSLVEHLKKMGMTIPFSEKANFSLITDEEQLSIDQVEHQAYLSIDEKGSVAAAATGATMGLTSAPPEKTIPFIVDHPFSFLIFDKKSETILFMGYVKDPKPVQQI